MIVLLIIVSVGIILYGYLLMDRLDRFITQGGFVKEPEASIEKEILLYGELDIIDEISLALDVTSITYDRTTEPEIKDGSSYQWIGAFSKNDANNLFICMSAKRKNINIRTMAKCNDMIYKNVFKQMDITVVLPNEVPVRQILAYFKG